MKGLPLSRHTFSERAPAGYEPVRPGRVNDFEAPCSSPHGAQPLTFPSHVYASAPP